MSLLLVTGPAPAVGTDLDADDDGVLDAGLGFTIVDAVAINDGGAGDLTYGGTTLGVAYDGLAFAPGGASRIPDGADTDAAVGLDAQRLRPRRHPGLHGNPHRR